MREEITREFLKERKRLNEIVMKYSSDKIKKIYSLDSQIYEEGVLPKKMKELLGLIASLVLRCDDCIKYHLVQCYDSNVSTDELNEALAIALIIGGSITIPHLREIFALWDEFNRKMHGSGEN